MKYIRKTTKEPPCLTEHRATPQAGYAGLHGDCKSVIRNRLLNEQGHLCAYCMQRISDEMNQEQGRVSIEIEHFRAQAGNDSMTLDYSNMLAVCNGFAKMQNRYDRYQEKEQKIAHCDKTVSGKGDGRKNLRVLDPRNPRCEELVKYSTTGRIEAADGNQDVTYDLETMLNLNIDKLRVARKEVLDEAARRLQASLGKNTAKPLTLTVLKSELAFWAGKKIKKDANGNTLTYYKPFCQAAIWYLNKKMNKVR